VGVRGLALVDVERAVALARGDQVALAAGGVVDGQALDVGGQAVLADPGDEGPGVARVGLGAVLPDADLLLADVEPAPLAVGDAPLGLRADGEAADAPGLDRPVARGRQAILLDAAVAVGDEGVGRAVAGAPVGAEAVGTAAAEGGDGGAGLGEVARLGVDRPELQAVARLAADAGDGEVDRAAVGPEAEAVEQVDVVRPRARGDELLRPAVEGVGVEAALLVGAEDEAPGRIVGMDPDGGVVRGVAGAGDRLGLGPGRGGGPGAVVGRGRADRQTGHEAEGGCEPRASRGGHRRSPRGSGAWIFRGRREPAVSASRRSGEVGVGKDRSTRPSLPRGGATVALPRIWR
jgi:hypothetical protein